MELKNRNRGHFISYYPSLATSDILAFGLYGSESRKYGRPDAQNRNASTREPNTDPEHSFYSSWKITKLLLSVGEWGMPEVLRIDVPTLSRENKIAGTQWKME